MVSSARTPAVLVDLLSELIVPRKFKTSVVDRSIFHRV